MLNIIFRFTLFFVCSFSVAQNNSAVLDSLLREGLKIEFDWAYPTNTGDLQRLANAGLFQNTGNSASQINLSGSDNYIEFKNDSIKGRLSYYGVRQMPGAYGAIDNGINFNGVPKNMELKKSKKGSNRIKFLINDENYSPESYQVWFTLKEKGSVSLSVNSSHRSSINYNGNIVAVKE